MNSNSDDSLVEEYDSVTTASFDESTITRQSPSSILSNSLFEETYTKQLDDRVRELKAELRTQCPTNWLTKFVPAEQNPKIELNLFLHGAIREQNFAELFQNNDLSFLQKFIQEIIHNQRQQNIIYTEILVRPDVFKFNGKTKLKDALKIIIDSIHLSTIKSSGNLFPTHIKLILSCNWNDSKAMNHFIRFAREYSDDIVGIDFYGEEDDCRKYWHDFAEYTKILNHYHIRYQANMASYQDLQLIDNVIQGLRIERISEPYNIILSSEHLENLCVKHGIHLVICPLSNAYTIANSKDNSYHLINYLQLESITFSIGSFSPFEYQQNLSTIYKNLFNQNENLFTCEQMQLLNENAIKISFANQQLKTELINLIRENYRNCYKQMILIQQFQQTTKKWQEEMCEIIDRNAQIAVEFAKKMHKEKLLRRINQSKQIEQRTEEEEETSYRN